MSKLGRYRRAIGGGTIRVASRSAGAKRLLLRRAGAPGARRRRARLMREGIVPEFVEVDLSSVGVLERSFLLETGSPVDQIAQQIWLDGASSYESPWPRVVASLGMGIQRAIVVGANTGFYAMLLANVDQIERVDALEPFPPAFLRLTRNLQESRLVDQVSAHCAAAAAIPGQMTLYVPDPLSSGWPLETSASLDPSFKSSHAAEHVVEATTLDLVANLSPLPVGLLFVDAEGCDMDVLAGAESLIARNSPFVIVEVSEIDLPVLNEFLRAHDYLAFEVAKAGMWLRTPVVHAVESSQVIGSTSRARYWSNLLAPASSLERVRSAASSAGLVLHT